MEVEFLYDGDGDNGFSCFFKLTTVIKYNLNYVMWIVEVVSKHKNKEISNGRQNS
jgi:hypothetical protein